MLENSTSTSPAVSSAQFEQMQAQRDWLESQLQAWIKTAQELQIKFEKESAKFSSFVLQIQNELSLSKAQINQSKQESESIKLKLEQIKTELNSSQKRLTQTEKELALTRLQLHQTQEELAYCLGVQPNSTIA